MSDYFKEAVDESKPREVLRRCLDPLSLPTMIWMELGMGDMDE